MCCIALHKYLKHIEVQPGALLLVQQLANFAGVVFSPALFVCFLICAATSLSTTEGEICLDFHILDFKEYF